MHAKSCGFDDQIDFFVQSSGVKASLLGRLDANKFVDLYLIVRLINEALETDSTYGCVGDLAPRVKQCNLNGVPCRTAELLYIHRALIKGSIQRNSQPKVE